MGKTRRKCPCGSGLRYNRCCGLRSQPLSADANRNHFKYDHSKPEDQIVGDRLFGRIVEQVIMSGGMGRVIVLRDSEGKHHALKSLPRERYKDIQLKKRFENEAKVWLFIPPHPNVVTARKYFTVQGRPFIAMDYHARGDLARYCEEHADELTIRKCLGFALQICDAMVHAARFGLKYHGDLKPQNCLVSDDGNSVLLGDFGLAKAANYLAEDAISSRLSWRSPSFASPEVIDRREITLASDIFSFGVMLYWLLFRDVPERKIDGTLDLPAHGEYHDAVALIERCCRLDPTDRVSSFELLRCELELVCSAITLESPPVAPKARGWDAVVAMTRAEDMLALGDGRRAVEACALALRDDFINSVLSIKSRVLLLKAYGLLMIREFPEAQKTCESILNSELRMHTPAGLVQEIESLLEIAKLPPEQVMTPPGFTGLTVTGKDAMLEQMNNMATRLNSAGRHSEALAIAQRCNAAFGPWDITLVNLANALAGLRQWESAKEHFQYAIERNPHNQLAYYNYALFLFSRGDVESALSNLDFALEIDPELSFAWAAKARLLARSFSRYEQALDCFSHAIKLDPYNRALQGERAELAKKVRTNASD